MKQLRIAATLVLCLLAAPLRGQEARYLNEGRQVVHELAGVIAADDAPVRVETDIGSVRITAAAGREVSYRIRVRALAGDASEARRLIDTLGVSAIRDGDRIIFSGKAYAPEHLARLTADFELTLPSATPSLEVLTGVGDVGVDGVEGEVTIITHGGRVSVGKVGGPLQVETRGGDIEVGQIRGDARLATGGGQVQLDSAIGNLVARTSGGDVLIGHVGGKVDAETGGGSVRIERASGNVTAGTNGGNIDLGRILGEVSAATAGGSIRVLSARRGVSCETAAGLIDLGEVLGPVRAITSAGNIHVRLSGHEAFADSNLQSLLGDVFVSLPASLPVTIRALVDDPVGAGIESEFPLAITRELQELGRPIAIAEGEVGGGGSLLKIHTLGGNIVIRRAEKTR
jgi:hypothetical protein